MAFEFRHNMRMRGRAMMFYEADVEVIKMRDMKKYGNPDGPTFDYLYNKEIKKGLTPEQAYERILESSSETCEAVDAILER